LTTLPSKRQDKVKIRTILDNQIYVKKGNVPKIIRTIKKARMLEVQQDKLQKEFVKLSAPDLKDYFWDCVHSIYPVEQDLKELFTSKRIAWT
jgi:hypothetical protein